MDSADDAKDWGSLLLNGDWEVPPPVWAKSRAREQVLEEKNEKTEESLEGVTSSLLTTPQRPVGQVRGTRLLGRLESQRGGESLHAGAGGGWVEGKTVFVSNQTQTTMLPQSFQSPMPTFAPVKSSSSSLCPA